ncbi:hypothetical protein EG68_04471 [Paragonimus skrjabini miyazakii]|uniref:Uncharacterized protein n=1 Tax=Paragonimus skrjabini miyazakii TaxID=59628 RepID=A0A8S9YWT3_9TREM|nr:hypothetical protein EG68_04471 [Paragonimus skrjabini miyazakii]
MQIRQYTGLWPTGRFHESILHLLNQL